MRSLGQRLFTAFCAADSSSPSTYASSGTGSTATMAVAATARCMCCPNQMELKKQENGRKSWSRDTLRSIQEKATEANDQLMKRLLGAISLTASQRLLQKGLSEFFRAYAGIVCRRPWLFVIVPLLLTVLLSVGLRYRKVTYDAIYLYTPLDARSFFEEATFKEHWPPIDGQFVPGRNLLKNKECTVIAQAADHSNVINEQTLAAVIRLDYFIANEVKVIHANVSYGYKDLCLRWRKQCFLNRQLQAVYKMTLEPHIYGRLKFPQTEISYHSFMIAHVFGGLQYKRNSGDVTEAKAVLLKYYLQFEGSTRANRSTLWELELERRLLGYKDSRISITFEHSQTLNKELKKNVENLTPKIVFSFVSLIIFALICTIVLVRMGGMTTALIDWTRSTPLLALAGVFSAAIGVLSTLGLCGFLGIGYCDIIAVMPFLVISVRLDNTFLMISALVHTAQTQSVQQRVEEAMSESAVSITITVLTDVISFGIGYFTSFAAVQLFCVYTSIAMAVTFFYQLTFFLALLVLQARNEEKQRHAFLPCVKTILLDNKLEKRNLFCKLFCLGSSVSSTATGCAGQTENDTGVSRWFRDVYAPFLQHRITKLSICIIYVIYLYFAIVGCLNVKEGMEPTNLLVEESKTAQFFSDVQTYFWNYGVAVQVAFNNPGDLSNSTNRDRIMVVVQDFADSEHGTGVEGVEFWLIQFEHFLMNQQQLSIDEVTRREFFSYLTKFFVSPGNEFFSNDVKMRRRDTTSMDTDLDIAAFRLLVYVKNFTTSIDQIHVVDQFRAIAARHAEYNITTFNIVWPFIDQYKEILPNILLEMYSGAFCMVAIALLLVPHPVCFIWVTLAMVSIDVGVIGYMSLWNLRLDCITMITLIMSIGFSVDFSAHISYGYAIGTEQDPAARIRSTLGNLAGPIVQGGMSTVIGVLALATAPSYMIKAFFKTIVLIIGIGVAHGIVVLPVLLTLTDLSTLKRLLPQRCSSRSNKTSSGKELSVSTITK